MNNCIRTITLIFLSVFFSNSLASADEPFSCGGEDTQIYTDSSITVSVCHGSYLQVDQSKLDQWQSCVDSLIYQSSNDKKSSSEIADCELEGKQFKVDGDHLLLRHFLTEYPGNESKPFLVENIDLKTGRKSFQYEREFPACTQSDVRKAIDQIETEIKKPFNGQTYFRQVYGGMYSLRDCAKSLPGLVLAHLREYRKRDVFDGEVAETLGEIDSEVELFYESAVDRTACNWSKPEIIPINDEFYFEVCDKNQTIRLNGKTVIKPNIPFTLLFPDCPECNMIWSEISPDNKTAVVWIENDDYQRNAWVINLESDTVKLFIDASKPEGKHFLVEFNGPDKFTIAHAGMGYRIDYYYAKEGSSWVNSGRKKIDVKW